MVQISNKIMMNPHMNLVPASISRLVKKVKETEWDLITSLLIPQS